MLSKVLIEHVVLVHKGHLAVDLREPGLAVRAQLLVAESLDDLKVAARGMLEHCCLLSGPIERLSIWGHARSVTHEIDLTPN